MVSWSWSGSKPFDTLMIFLNEISKPLILRNISRWQTNIHTHKKKHFKDYSRKIPHSKLAWNLFKPSSKIFYWPFQGGTSFVDLYIFAVLCLLCLCARLFICALWSRAGKGLTYWLSFVVSNCEFVNFPLVSLVRCCTWLYRFLIFAPLLTLQIWF